jgi:hypothetical protein
MAIAQKGIWKESATQCSVAGMNERWLWLFVPNLGTMSPRARICEAPQL